MIVDDTSYEVELPLTNSEYESIENAHKDGSKPSEEVSGIVHKYIAVAEKQALEEQLEQFRKGYSRRWQY